MIDKTNDIYNRWSQGQDVPTVVLKHTMDDYHSEFDDGNYQQTSYQQQQQQTRVDSFAYAHRSLAQCIVEVHERARVMFPKRKPCQCSAASATSCPPSHSWSPPPKVSSFTSPVLPGLTSPVLAHAALYHPTPGSTTGTIVPGDVPTAHSPLSPTSRSSLINPLHIEIGAISINNDQGLMSFF